MKKFVLGLIIGILIFPILTDAVAVLNWFYPKSKVVEALDKFTFMPTYGWADPFIENCTKDISKNGHGWVFVNREYYKCGKIAIWISDHIYGEYENK